MSVEFGGRQRRSIGRILIVVAGGLIVGALLTELAIMALPASAARQFFITTVAASLGPLTVDLLVIAVTLGPLVLRMNILSLLGIVLVAWFARSLL